MVQIDWKGRYKVVRQEVTAQAVSNYFVQDFERDRGGFLITG